MLKKYLVFFSFLVLLVGCGTDYILSSFYLRKDFEWLAPPAAQKTLNDEIYVAGSYKFNEYNSPVVFSTKDNYLMIVYEFRDKESANVIGVDGSSVVNINILISKNAYDFNTDKTIGEFGYNATKSHGSPVVFLTKNNEIVVLSTGGFPGYGTGGTAKDVTSLSVSISSDNGGNWTDWQDIDTNVFKPLLDKGYNRFYTSTGNGLTLQNGTLVCMVDYKKNGESKSAGAAILYSNNNGKDWQLGSTMEYTAGASGKRFARVLAEKSNGSLLIAAVHDTRDDYNASGSLYWAEVESLNGTIKGITVSGLEANSGSSIGLDKIKFTHNGVSYNGFVLVHSTPDRIYNHPSLGQQKVKNAMSISISKDEGQTWTLIKNEFGVPPEKTSFRQSLKVLKDGTIATCIEQGAGVQMDVVTGFSLVYRRFGLAAISDEYSYEGM